MKKRLAALDAGGFTLVEILIAFGAVVVLSMLGIGFLANNDGLSTQTQFSSTKDRIVAGVRKLVGSPAALRNSMQALAPDGVSAANPMLLACAGGNPVNKCDDGISTPVTVYSPMVAFAPDGSFLGVTPITSPVGSTTPQRFDAWGSPCTPGDATCPLIVYTSAVARCNPLPMTGLQLQGPVTAAQMQPQPTCTVANTIEVTYSIELDSALSASNPSLQVFATGVTGTVATPVLLISGNQPM